MQREVEGIYLADAVYAYIVSLVTATRNHPLVRQGGSPRASLALMRLSQAAAFLAGRDYVIPEDVEGILYDAVAHRLILDTQAKMQGRSTRDILGDILSGVEIPGTGMRRA